MLAGMTWRFVGLYSRAFLNLFVLATLSRLLSPQDFGVMGVATIFIGLAEIFSQLGVGPALVQRPDLNPKHMRVAFTLAVLMGTVMLLMLWVAAPFIALFFRDDKIAAVLCGVSFTFLLRGFGAVPQALLRRELQFKKLMWVDLASYTLGYAVVGLTMAWSGYGVWSLVGATLSQSLVQSVMLLITERPPLKPSFARQELKDLVYFGGGVTLARLFNFAAGKGDYFVVGRALGVEPLGMYTRAYRLMNLPANYLGRVLDTVLFPVMGKIQHQLPRLTKSYLTGVAMIGLVCAPVGVLMVVMAPELVGVVLGSQWSEAVIPLQVLALGVLPRVSYKIDNSLAKAMGAVYRRSARDAVYAANNVMAFRMSLSLLGCSFTQYVRAQLPGLIIALIAAGVAFPTRRLLHSHGMPDLVTLALTSAVSCLVVGALFLWRPREIAGRYGTDAVIMVFRSIPDRFFPRIVLQWFNTRVAGSAL
jgi:PST family polysaccharide transporter